MIADTVTSDTVQIITVICGLLGTVFTGIMVYLMAKLKQSADIGTAAAVKAAEKVEMVATKVADVKDTLNENTTDKLNIQVVAALAKAGVTGLPVDVKVAQVTEQALIDHRTRVQNGH